MNDSKGFGFWVFSFTVKVLVFFPALYLSGKQAVKSKKLGDYFMSLAFGNDTFGNRLIAPHANVYWVKPGGRQYGAAENISVTMAWNKKHGFSTEHADKWERYINKFDKNHLEKTYKKVFLNNDFSNN